MSLRGRKRLLMVHRDSCGEDAIGASVATDLRRPPKQRLQVRKQKFWKCDG